MIFFVLFVSFSYCGDCYTKLSICDVIIFLKGKSLLGKVEAFVR